MKRDNYFDKLVTTYFDNLWESPAYLDMMSNYMNSLYKMRTQWNKNMENFLSIMQLPNQELQQKTLHTVNTLLYEWRFEQDELKSKIEKIEEDIQNLKSEQSEIKKNDELLVRLQNIEEQLKSLKGKAKS
ncbi:MAG: hypothetical protein U0354_00665 [Candidatus Sericytochromatia bacterium]